MLPRSHKNGQEARRGFCRLSAGHSVHLHEENVARTVAGVHHHGVAIAAARGEWEQERCPFWPAPYCRAAPIQPRRPYRRWHSASFLDHLCDPRLALREANSAYARATSSGDRRQALPIPNNVSLSQSADGPRRPNRSTTSQTSAGDTSAAS